MVKKAMGFRANTRYARGGRLHAFFTLRVALPLVGNNVCADQRENRREAENGTKYRPPGVRAPL
jgi:hypothetical protein